MICNAKLDDLLEYGAEASRALLQLFYEHEPPALQVFIVDCLTRDSLPLTFHCNYLLHDLFQLFGQLREIELGIFDV